MGTSCGGRAGDAVWGGVLGGAGDAVWGGVLGGAGDAVWGGVLGGAGDAVWGGVLGGDLLWGQSRGCCVGRGAGWGPPVRAEQGMMGRGAGWGPPVRGCWVGTSCEGRAGARVLGCRVGSGGDRVPVVCQVRVAIYTWCVLPLGQAHKGWLLLVRFSGMADIWS